MPFLRVIRDKRGYETTYLMQWYQEGSRQRARILYAFRTPGGMRVGRQALDPEVQRQVQLQFPDIDFNWKAVVESQQVIDANPEPRTLRRPRRRRDEDRVAAPAPAVVAPRQVPAEPPTAEPPRPAIPSAIEGATPDEQVAFLAHWYPLVRERVERRTPDPMRREALLALAERLNLAGWTDADTLTTGLAAASEALERLSRVFAKRRRRARKPRRPEDASVSAAPPSVAASAAPES